MSTEICIKTFTRRRIKHRNRQHSFSISLNFYQTFLELSPQTRFMFDKKKLLLINAQTYIPRETQDELLRIAINLPEFHQIHHWTGDFYNPLTSRSQTLDRPMVSCLGLTIRSQEQSVRALKSLEHWTNHQTIWAQSQSIWANC